MLSFGARGATGPHAGQAPRGKPFFTTARRHTPD